MTERAAGKALVDAGRLAASAAAQPDAEQLSLLPPSRFKAGGAAHARQVERVERARKGRPPGSENRNTKEMKEFFYRLFGDPLMESARWTLHTPESLALELGCTKGEAFDRLERIRADLRRFFYAPLAAVDDKGNAVAPQFTMIAAPGAQVAVAVGGRLPWETPASGYSEAELAALQRAPETQQNQGVSQSPAAVSDDAVSDGEAK